MYILKIILIISLSAPMVLIILSFTLSKKVSYNQEKLSPFECGFDPKSMARLPFSLHFFLITVIFLIFDVEITLLLPIITTFNVSMTLNWFMITFIFIWILLIGLYHEWNQNMLNWTN
uniref:NADH-ubiquinone oxidoreductase chain 3 n=1 Tax=Phryganopsyche latipennis TaxID=177652 RepID=A0A4Y1JWM3_9NEOP|nr:NADH dehydrogenase subunit 3 [Phryganopsyche latipennis]APQ47896.1 NADH dehydrogenase subunit 3 [Phryganopsyche latipennis]